MSIDDPALTGGCGCGAVARDHHSFRIRRAGKGSVRIRVGRATKLARGVRIKKGQVLRVRAPTGEDPPETDGDGPR